LAKFAVEGLKKSIRNIFFTSGQGVVLMDFEDTDRYRLSLFFNANPNHKLLMEKVDAINRLTFKKL
jgi:hypothetical protein